MHLDTHAVIWLFIRNHQVFPTSARRLLDTEPLTVSPMVLVELDLLHDIGRTEGPASVVLDGLRRSVGLTVSEAPSATVVGSATALTWTRDPFDRLICAQAVAEQEPLLTKDRRIRSHLDLATWD